MSDIPPQNGDLRRRSGLPSGIVVASVVIALVAVSLLLLLLYRETRGPGEILRLFARAVDAGDCTGSYELIDASVYRDLSEDEWCESVLPAVDGYLDADFDLEQAVLEGDQARVEVSGIQATVWHLRRYGERSWRVLGPDGFAPEPLGT